MPEFDSFRVKAQAALNQCLAVAQENRANTGVQDTPYSFLQPLIDQHIVPLVGPDNGANVQLSSDPKHDWRKNALELIYRQALYDIVIAYSEPNDILFQRIFDCLDMVLISSEKNLVEPVTVLTLIEELLEQQTISGCEKIFDYIESRKTKLTVDMVPGKGKGLVLLRMCNEMLRRLSKNKSTVFCGRILMFLANSFPLGERSGVNLRGEFNVENVVKFDSEEELKEDARMTEDQKAFYTLFWSTQSFLTNPPSIFVEGNYEKFKTGVEATLSRFNDMSQREAVVAGSTADHQGKDAWPRKRSANEMEVDEFFSEEAIRDVYNDYFFPKFLTSRELLELELADVSFRRTVLVQFLVVFQYLDGYRSNEIEKTQAMLSSKGGKPLAAQTQLKLTEEQESWISEERAQTLKELQATNPYGREYTRIVELVLAHEKNWIVWKAASCPPFEMPPIDPKEFSELISSKRRRLTATMPPYRYVWGNAEITGLYHRTLGRDLTNMMSELPDLPSARDYLDDVLPRLQNSTASVEARYELANAIVFQIMRLLFLKEAHLVSKVFLAKKELMKIAREIVTMTAKAGEADGEMVDEMKGSDSNRITERSVEIEIKVLQQARKIINDDEEARRASEAKLANNGEANEEQTSVPALQNSPSQPIDEAKNTETDEVNIATQEQIESQVQASQPKADDTKENETKTEDVKMDPMDTDPQNQDENQTSKDSPNDSAMQEDRSPGELTGSASPQEDKAAEDEPNATAIQDEQMHEDDPKVETMNGAKRGEGEQ